MLKTLVLAAVGAVAGIVGHKLFGAAGVAVALAIVLFGIPFWQGYKNPRKRKE